MFKVGDRIVVTNCTGAIEKYNGENGTVTGFGTHTVVCNMDNYKKFLFFYHSEVELLEETKTWGEMTPEEKGALLLAHHEGKTIEFFSVDARKWYEGTPRWSYWVSYRVKPEPKAETIECQWSYEKGGKDGYTHPKNSEATHKIVFDVVDGVPDCESIKMEKL
jgi:hypothetical protein